MCTVAQRGMDQMVSRIEIGSLFKFFRGDLMQHRSRYKGFTLTELLIVLVIIGLLAALVGPVLYQRINPAKQSVARAQMESFMTALDSFFLDVGKFPSQQQGLNSLRVSQEGGDKWRGPYLKKDIPSDPWGNPFVYHSPGRNGGYEIISYGADGKEGGEGENADINSWESKK